MLKLYKIIEKAALWSGCVLLILLMLSGFFQVLARNLFRINAAGLEETMRMSVLWLIFAGAILTTLRGQHIAIDILPRFLGKKGSGLSIIIRETAAGFISFYIGWQGVRFVKMEQDFDTLIAGFLPVWIGEIIIPAGFFLMGIVFLIRMMCSWRGIRCDNGKMYIPDKITRQEND